MRGPRKFAPVPRTVACVIPWHIARYRRLVDSRTILRDSTLHLLGLRNNALIHVAGWFDYHPGVETDPAAG